MTPLIDLVGAESGTFAATVERVLARAKQIGAVVGPEEFLPGGEDCLPLWSDLVVGLRPRGWHAEVGWDGSAPRLVMLPRDATVKDYDASTCWWLTVEAYGDGTINIHGCRPTPEDAADLDFVDYATVADALADIPS